MSNKSQEQQDALVAEGLLWLESEGRVHPGLTPMAGDVSSRKYFRVRGGLEILAHYPPDLMQSYECFVRTDELLLRAGVLAPEVLAVDASRRFMLTQDVGERQLSAESDMAVVLPAIAAAVEVASRIERLDPVAVATLSPALETELLTRELRQSCQVFFRQRLSQAVSSELEQVLYEMCQRLGSGRLVPAHRDFMARNLMLVWSQGSGRRLQGLERLTAKIPDLVVLDHQDLRLAPWGYDLASLFYDSCPLPAEQAVAQIDDLAVNDEHREAIARCAAQRCIKIVGTFVGFAARGEDRYLSKVPGALRTAARELSRLSEATPSAIAVLEDCAADLD